MTGSAPGSGAGSGTWAACCPDGATGCSAAGGTGEGVRRRITATRVSVGVGCAAIDGVAVALVGAADAAIVAGFVAGACPVARSAGSGSDAMAVSCVEPRVSLGGAAVTAGDERADAGISVAAGWAPPIAPEITHGITRARRMMAPAVTGTAQPCRRPDRTGSNASNHPLNDCLTRTPVSQGRKAQTSGLLYFTRAHSVK